MNVSFKYLVALFILIITIENINAQVPYSKELENKAKNGDIEAMVTVGEAYLMGNGVKKSPKDAEKWLKMAAKNKSVKAYNRLVDAYQSWDLIEKDVNKAKKWAQKGADADLPELRLRYAEFLIDEGNPSAARQQAVKALQNGYWTALIPAAYYNTRIHRYSEAYALYALAKSMNLPLNNDQKRILEKAALIASANMGRSDILTMNYIGVVCPEEVYAIASNSKLTVKQIEEYMEYTPEDSPQYAMLKALTLICSGEYDTNPQETVDLIRIAAEGGIPEAENLMAIITSPSDALRIVKEGDGFDEYESDIRQSISIHENFNDIATLIKKNLNFPAVDNWRWMLIAGANGTPEGALIKFYGKADGYTHDYNDKLIAWFSTKEKGTQAVMELAKMRNISAMANKQIQKSNGYSRNVDEEKPVNRSIDFSNFGIVRTFYRELVNLTESLNNQNKKDIINAAENALKYYPIDTSTIGADIMLSSHLSEDLQQNKIDNYIVEYPDMLAEFMMIRGDKLTEDIKNVADIETTIKKLIPKLSNDNKETFKKWAYKTFNILL